ncbi:MAG: HAD family phosphatase [Kiritimatiellae bacterium]|nr:HAD family phosphatase [Kiritimatiellia bacterium]
MKKAAVFDFGGVMTTSTMPTRVKDEVGMLGIPWKVIEDGFAKYRHPYDAGKISMEEMYSSMWRDAGLDVAPETTSRIIEADRASWLYRNERTLAWMRSLKADGHAIGILTNMAPDFAPLFKEHFADFIELADAMVISGLELMHKPERRIYDLLYSRLNAVKPCPPGNLVFFDDVAENCEGARAAGWLAIQFKSNDQVERDFAQLT